MIFETPNSESENEAAEEDYEENLSEEEAGK
jgi:hypothetical protein